MSSSHSNSVASTGIPGLDDILRDPEYRVLVLAPTGRDAALAGQVLSEAGIQAWICQDFEDLQLEIRRGAGALLLTEEALNSAALEELARIFASQLPWSELPLLVFSGGKARAEPDNNPVRQLTQHANVTLLDRPTRRVTLTSAVRVALRARRRQYEVRDLLLQLHQGVRERDQFLAMLGHELRNPLGAISNAVQLMERKGPKALAQERALIHRQTRLLSRLVDDLLDVSRVTTGKIALDRTLVDVRELVGRCVQARAVTAAERRIDLTFSAGDSPFVVEGDTVRLEQVVNNLLTNALKYTPAGGSVSVSVMGDGTCGEIRVHDSGVGIDASVLPRVFDLFTQADSTLDRSQGGLGVGLTLVRSLVALHGGTVRAESPGPGKGSTFIVRLPRAAGGAPHELPKKEQPAVPRPRRILLIEDNRDVREGLMNLLQQVGHQVVAAQDGLEGVELALRDPPEVALIDIGLPKLDGYTVARSLRDALKDRVVLVALTGYGLVEDRRRAIQAGFDAHLTKPVALSSILRLLGDVRGEEPVRRRQNGAPSKPARPGAP
jgi:signal transduction histidine kinase/ActR/RegA family two-component response regulator